MKDEEISVEDSVIKRMIEEKGTYGFEDMCRLQAEEVCRRKGIPITEDFFQGFLEASKLDTEKKKARRKMSEADHHYKIHKPSPLELIQRYNLSFIEGNIVKYVLRSPFKSDSVGDLNKALSYAQLLQDIGFYRQFEASELNEYTELNAIEKEIVCDVLRSDVTCVVQKLQKAIGIRGMENVKKELTKHFTDKKQIDTINTGEKARSRLQNETD